MSSATPPLSPLDTINEPLQFIVVRDVLTLVTGICWTVAYALYIRQGFKDKSYGMPLIAVCINIGWELIYGIVYPLSLAETLAFTPWFFMSLAIVYTTIRFGPEQWKSAPVVADNLVFIMAFSSVAATAFHLAFHNMFDDHEEAAFWSGNCCQVFLGLSSLAQLVSRDNTRGHSMTIWGWRYVGTASAILMWEWRYWNYPEDNLSVGSPMAIFIFVSAQAADLLYPFVYAGVRKREGLKDKAQ